MGLEKLHGALLNWLRAVVDDTSSADRRERTAAKLVQHPAWRPVGDIIHSVASPERRPDLYSSPESGSAKFQAQTFLRESGVAALLQDAAVGEDLTELSVQMAEFFAAPLATAETWLLVDADIASGPGVMVGGYKLRVPTSEELRHLTPVPLAFEYLDSRERIDASLLGGSAFLSREDSNRRVSSGLWISLTRRPELLVWRPLITLSLWSPNVVQLAGKYVVAQKRRISVQFEEVRLDYQIYDDEEVEYHRFGFFSITSAEFAAFERFCEAVDGRIDSLLTYTMNTPGARHSRERSRRLETASRHIVRASQLTQADGTAMVDEMEEITLHYVIALEALLSDDRNLEIGRKVQQRAAALGLTDRRRIEIEAVVKKAYDARSRYAHGDESISVDLMQLRAIVLDVMLRWIVVESALPSETTIAKALDRTLLSRHTWDEYVGTPLQTFFNTSPPASLATDLSHA